MQKLEAEAKGKVDLKIFQPYLICQGMNSWFFLYLESNYTTQMSQKTYSRLMKLETMLARLGFSVILDAKYDKQQLRGEIIEQADRE